MSASTDDLRNILKQHCDDATRALGKETSQIQSQASLHGALGSGRLGIQYIEAAERAWRGLVETAIDGLKRFEQITGLARDSLVLVVREELDQALGHLREASKFDAKASGRFQSGAVAEERYEVEWARLQPYLDLRLRRWELGMDDTPEQRPPSITYSITAETISGPIQQGTRDSTQTVVVSSDTLLTKLEATIQSEVAEQELQRELLELVKDLHAKQGTSEFLGVYQRFMGAAANHMTVLAPFLPALAQLIR